MTYAELRAEGVIEVGRVDGLVFARTRRRVVLAHINTLDDRELEPRALERAIRMFESGYNEFEVSAALGVNHNNLRAQLRAIGYERQSLESPGPRRGAQARRGGWHQGHA